ncbi:hypothetical protein BS78_K161900 [Paspalum vaginatum]|uniref:DUF3511 domain-containing protein n=1 Tax=Paspalum vaginatum TaxID=158149 RepID=A0A9W7XAX7_9POAL|nr:hypothetical protein BS78_K161900 [Paspalum vaginatum]
MMISAAPERSLPLPCPAFPPLLPSLLWILLLTAVLVVVSLSTPPAGLPSFAIATSPSSLYIPACTLNIPSSQASRPTVMAPSYRPYAAGEEQRKQKPAAGARWVRVAAWCGLGGDPAEMKRRRRVAGYKAYAVEGKVKASIRRGLRWMKAKCCGGAAHINASIQS